MMMMIVILLSGVCLVWILDKSVCFEYKCKSYAVRFDKKAPKLFFKSSPALTLSQESDHPFILNTLILFFCVSVFFCV